ncbi:cation:proton antiporter domain-containing protein [Haladaptatus cibarius]|uniref:cation:proton antiporter domain-containing protein n=1 Tax=Haladaptatus cibarius TaxID=453847 RepID=UPI0006784DEC|nr:cation:proton antiporter [Haladaptatus cibarius]
MATDALLASASIILLGAVSKLLADRFGVPNVVFLLGFGILFGPEVVGLLDPSLFSNALSTIVSLAVAIIVFEGAFNLTSSRIRSASTATLRLVTLGSAITFLGLGLTIRYLLDLQWSLSFLISALLVATGPTVITPILEQTDVRENVKTTLETEGIVNDPVASVLGAVIFSAAALGERPFTGGGPVGEEIVIEFVTQLGVGVLIGIVTAVSVIYVLRNFSRTPQNSRITVIATALISFAVADLFASEAGVVSVAVAGLLVGNADIPYEEEIEGFSGDVTAIVLSVVYIILASLLRFEELVEFGLAGVAVVLIAMLVFRPLSVFLSTIRSDFSRNERLFISAVGPRGIIPASTATLFSLQLAQSNVANAESVVSVVFLVILVTVVLEAGGAPFIAQRLDIVPMTILIIGGSRIGRTLAERLEERGENPIIIERDVEVVTDLRADGYSVVHGNGTSAEVLDEAGVEGAKMVVAATSEDDQNILACQTARTKFGVENLLAQVNDTENVDAFEDLGVRTTTPTLATVDTMDDLILRPSFFAWLSGVGEENDVTEVTADSASVVGRQLGDIDFPDESTVVLVQRDSEYIIPKSDVVLEEGDVVTLLGTTDAVEDAARILSE